ncbi:MAG: PDZ domain-containing protein [Pirellulaceae bacterium]
MTTKFHIIAAQRQGMLQTDRILRRCIFFLVLACFSSSLLADEVSVPSPKAIQAWISELDHDEYDVRVAATEKLVQHPEQAIIALKSRITGGTLEFTIRAIQVLTRIAVSDTAANEQAQLAILNISELRPTLASRYARSSLNQISVAARKRSIQNLRDKGAIPIYLEEDVPDSGLQGFMFGDEWNGQEQDFRLLQFITGIQVLELVGAKVESSWFNYFARIPTLTMLRVRDASLNRQAIEKLNELESLRNLEFKFVRINDASVPSLVKLQQLRTLTLIGTDVTSDGEAVLQTSMTGTQIDRRVGGFLGVLGQAHPIGCLVEVREKSAAEEAGIKTGDVIVELNGTRIANFEALRDEIKVHPPGAAVKVRVLRAETFQAYHVYQKGDVGGAKFEKHELGLKIVTLAGANSFLVRRNFREGDVIVQYHTFLQPTEIQFNAIVKQAEMRWVKNSLRTQMSLVAVRHPEFLEFDVILRKFP